MQGNADRTTIGSPLVEQRVQMAHRKQHRDQQHQDACCHRNLAGSNWGVGLHAGNAKWRESRCRSRLQSSYNRGVLSPCNFAPHQRLCLRANLFERERR